ncbi:hypothetical protein [Calothrix rhizosoleniae]|uniref:hypothetical protein n=1 Tax=Calothrix rhizosoleniae TaxID=888997 RepID=UPI00190EAE30|nr:hypothetical protein [Calothrix rhizosoleniae]
MPRKRLSNLIKEEAQAQKLTPNQTDESTIDVEAKAVDNQDAESSTSTDTDSPTEMQANTTPTAAPKSPNSKPMAITKADLEITVQELKQDLEQADKTEAELREQVAKLQSDLSTGKSLTEKLNQELTAQKSLTEKLNQELAEGKSLTEKLNQELAEGKSLIDKVNAELNATKKDALQLAETNTKLTDEIEAFKQENIKPGAIQRRKMQQESSIVHKSTKYPKRTPRPIVSKNRSQEEGAENSTQMWLLD